MNKQQEALKLALEALKELRMLGMNAQWHDSWLAKPNEAIAAIREALAEQPEQQESEANHAAWMAAYTEGEREAIEKQTAQQQKPVAYQCKGIPRKGCNYLAACDRVCNKCGEIHHHHQMVANFAAPPAQRKPLTDDEIYKIANDLFYGNGPCDTLAMCRAIEAAHGIKGDA